MFCMMRLDSRLMISRSLCTLSPMCKLAVLFSFLFLSLWSLWHLISVFWIIIIYRYQRSTTAISVGKLLQLLANLIFKKIGIMWDQTVFVRGCMRPFFYNRNFTAKYCSIFAVNVWIIFHFHNVLLWNFKCKNVVSCERNPCFQMGEIII